MPSLPARTLQDISSQSLSHGNAASQRTGVGDAASDPGPAARAQSVSELDR